MEYIVTKRFKGVAITGDVNLPYGTELECSGGVISTLDGKSLCFDHSQNAYDYMARNDDGRGLERGKLTQDIVKRLAVVDDKHQARWNELWDDERAEKFRRKDHGDFWLWSYDFYNAEIADLEYILYRIESV